MKTAKSFFKYIVVFLVAASASASFATDMSRRLPEQWVTTWGAAAMASTSAGQPERRFENQTIRQIVHISAGGTRVRVRLSNEFGTQPLQIGAAHLALYASGASIVASSDRLLKFGGQPTITIPAGAVALSDSVDLPLLSLSDLAISIYFPADTGPATYHDSNSQTAYISGPGDFTGATTMTAQETNTSRYFLTAVEVSVPTTFGKVPAVVTLGDSITEGFRSTTDANHRWPDYLSARVNRRYGVPQLGVVNEGIGCGRLLFDFCGPNGSARFDRDVVAVTGRTYVINALGLVDIIFPTAFGVPAELVSANDIIQGMKQLIERAHAQGILIYGATITPFGANAFPGVFTPENEAKRQAINRWIRTSGAYDAYIDFDAAVRDPGDPTRMSSAYVSDDGIHPNDAGYEAMANTINLALFY